MQDGQIARLSYHEARYRKAMRHFFPEAEGRRLIDILKASGLAASNDALRYAGVIKVHVDYGAAEAALTLSPYRPKQVERLRMVADDGIDYAYKYADRSALNRCLAQRGHCDDVIIVKNGLLTDTSYSNIALFDGSSWLTPRQPLLRGTMRAFLIDSGQLQEADIRPSDVSSFSKLSLINAMLPLGCLVIPTQQIE